MNRIIDLINIPFGKRNLGLWDQFSLSNRDEVVRVIQQHLGYRNIGISCCSFVNGDEILLFLFFDFDSEDISLAWEDAKRTYNHFVEMGCSCCLDFSGKKGWHVLVETEPKNYSSKQLKDVQKFYRDILGLETLDEQTFGDKRRLFRVPWTYNVNGTWCRMIAWNDGEKLDLDEIITETYVDEKEEIESTPIDESEIRNYNKPCIEWLIHSESKDYWIKNHPRHTFEPSEPVRLSWAGIRIWSGKSVNEMIDEAKSIGWADFDEDKIRKKLEYLEGRKWTPHSCDSLEALGYCVDWVDCRWRWIRTLKKLGIGNGNGGI